MKIAFFEVEEWEKIYFRDRLGKDIEMIFFDSPLNVNHIPQLTGVNGLVIFIYSSVTKEILERLPELVFVASMSTGTDHIDALECKKRDILVCNVPTYGEHTVAEHAFALILSISRKIIESNVKVHEWCFAPTGLTGFDLAGKTLGVLGVGNIGKNVIKIAHGFNMNVIGYKRSPDPDLEKEFNFKIVDLATLYKTSDIITIHVPYSKDTHHLVSTEAFSLMKKGVVVINTARGAILDTKALLQALDNGIVLGAGLDVLEDEPMLREEKQLLSREFDSKELLCILENHMLLSHKNVLITPHNAFNSKEALEKILETTIGNIRAFLARIPQNVV